MSLFILHYFEIVLSIASNHQLIVLFTNMVHKKELNCLFLPNIIKISVGSQEDYYTVIFNRARAISLFNSSLPLVEACIFTFG